MKSIVVAFVGGPCICVTHGVFVSWFVVLSHCKMGFPVGVDHTYLFDWLLVFFFYSLQAREGHG
jgi:hypothetical protein